MRAHSGCQQASYASSCQVQSEVTIHTSKTMTNDIHLLTSMGIKVLLSSVTMLFERQYVSLAGHDAGSGGGAYAAKLIVCLRRRANTAPHPHLTPGAGIANLCTAVPAGTWPGSPNTKQVPSCSNLSTSYSQIS